MSYGAYNSVSVAENVAKNSEMREKLKLHGREAECTAEPETKKNPRHLHTEPFSEKLFSNRDTF